MNVYGFEVTINDGMDTYHLHNISDIKLDLQSGEVELISKHHNQVVTYNFIEFFIMSKVKSDKPYHFLYGD